MPPKQQKMSISGTAPKTRKREDEFNNVNFSSCDSNFLARSLNNAQQTKLIIISKSPLKIIRSCTAKNYNHGVNFANRKIKGKEVKPGKRNTRLTFGQWGSSMGGISGNWYQTDAQILISGVRPEEKGPALVGPKEVALGVCPGLQDYAVEFDRLSLVIRIGEAAADHACRFVGLQCQFVRVLRKIRDNNCKWRIGFLQCRVKPGWQRLARLIKTSDQIRFLIGKS